MIGETERRRVSPAESRRLGLGIAYQTYSHVLAPVGGREPLPRSPVRPPTDVRTHGRLGGRPAGRVRPRPLAVRAHGDALARGATAPRGRQGAARPAEGAAPRRADDGPRAGGRRPPACARSRAEPRRRRDRLRQPSPARGPRHRGSDQRSPRRRVPGNVRGGLDVGGEPRRAHDRASAPARVSAAPRARDGARGAARGLGTAGRPVRADRPRGGERRDRRNRGRGGQRAGAVPPGARRRGAGHGNGDLRRQGARLELAARAAARGSRAAERRPGVRIALPGPERPRQCDDPGPAAARTPGVPQPPSRAAHGRRSRAAPEHPDGVDRAVGADALGREPAEGLADTAVPARGRQGHPGRGADPGRRRRRPIRHLRRAAARRRRRASRRSSSRATRSSSRASATGWS